MQGKRVTNEAMLDIVKMVLAGKINKEIVCNLNRQNIKAIGISGQDGDLLKCRKAFLPTGEDIGWVGEIIRVNTKILLDMLEDGLIPVIAPVGYDDDGNSYNINADDAAGDIASAFPAEKLIYLSDVAGVMIDDKRVASLNEETANAMIANGQITKGMIPKVNSAFDTLNQGVKKVHMLDGRVLHSLLVEIYTDSGIGTQFVLK